MIYDLQSIWNLKVQILPVVMVMFLVEIPSIVRKYTKLPYVPIYFALFPLDILNKDVSVYLNDDRCIYSSDMSLKELNLLRKSIIQKVFISFILSLGLIPLVGGAIGAIIMPKDALVGFIAIFILYKLIGIIRAALDFRYVGVSNTRNIILFCLVYIIYFIFFLRVFQYSYSWCEAFISHGNWSGLFWGIIDQLIVSVIVGGAMLGWLGTYFMRQIVKPENRLVVIPNDIED